MNDGLFSTVFYTGIDPACLIFRGQGFWLEIVQEAASETPSGHTRCTFANAALVVFRPDNMAAFTVSMSALVGAPVKVRRVFAPSTQSGHRRCGHQRVFPGGMWAKKRARAPRRRRRGSHASSGRRDRIARHHRCSFVARDSRGVRIREGRASTESRARPRRDVIAVPASLIQGRLGFSHANRRASQL